MNTFLYVYYIKCNKLHFNTSMNNMCNPKDEFKSVYQKCNKL